MQGVSLRKCQLEISRGESKLSVAGGGGGGGGGGESRHAFYTYSHTSELSETRRSFDIQKCYGVYYSYMENLR